MVDRMSGTIVILDEDNRQLRFQYNWQAHSTAITDGAAGFTPWQSIDIFFKQASKSPVFSCLGRNVEDTHLSIELSAGGYRRINPQDFGSAAAFRFVLECLSASTDESGSVVRLIVPLSRGYIVRSDIIPLRLLDCPLVRSAVSFSKPHQFFDGESISLENLERLPNAFVASVGGLLLKCTDTPESLIASLDLELRYRLSFPWLSTQVPKRQTLAIVDGGISSPDHGGTGTSIYAAAAAFGIDMVVLDRPTHWINDPRYIHWRKASIPFETPLHVDSEFITRIADAVRSYEGQIDGSVTFRDHYKVVVAEAALRLSLPTYPPSAYEIATDKFKTSVSEGHQAYQASNFEQAARLVQEQSLEFPLIIKPCNGFLSEGVFRAESLRQIEAGIQAINTERHGVEFVIEKYCEEPEVDANFVLCDGEVIFFEVSNDFPKGADANGQGSVKTFIELANVLPFKLPEIELVILRDSLQRSLLRVGFRDGFYHLEARVENSSMEYATKNSVLVLTKRTVPAKGLPSAWLIEINPRPPGIQGIDYWSLGLLFPLNESFYTLYEYRTIYFIGELFCSCNCNCNGSLRGKVKSIDGQMVSFD
ncbi:ATP-grasp domain-containing protein [Daldinia loculata]|uniref:ATP-grasp domain-containing protein n=1 Tax=Daldinia loculata TaxID=103429 RepID=UPI0020C551A1|nr:ATP-grasp domain-containing protein [Daldinia loculata]KAI1647984.1 ATP-grasp domain-containing protein [Daldinia loculata]